MLECDQGVERLFIDRVNKLRGAWGEGGPGAGKAANSWAPLM